LFTYFNSNAQTYKSILYMANKEYNNQRYAYAIPFYKKYILNNEYDTLALIRLGNSYLFQSKYNEALFYFQQANRNHAELGNTLAELYATVGNYDAASRLYETIINSKRKQRTKNQNILFENRLNGFRNKNFYYKDSQNYSIKYLSLNTGYNEIANVFYKNGIIFQSDRSILLNRKNEYGWNGNGFTKLYFADSNSISGTGKMSSLINNEKEFTKSLSDLSVLTANDNATFEQSFDIKTHSYNSNGITLLNIDHDSNGNYGMITIQSDQKTAYYTRNSKNKIGSSILEIWQAVYDGNHWKKDRRMFFNDNEHSYFHPSVSSDGNILYFASDRPGGFGGTDLYYIYKLINGSWSEPINAGEKINTYANELFPTLNNDILYFSSNGHPGLGGLDIYKVIINEKDTVIENLGYPYNSDKDDINYIKKENFELISSDRNGTDDIYIIKSKEVKKELVVQKIKSTVDKDTDGDGINDNDDLCPTIPGTRENHGCPEIKQEEKQKIILAANNIYFGFDKSDLLDNSFGPLNEVVTILKNHPEIKLFISAHTDNFGDEAYNYNLSELRALSVKLYLTSKGIEEKRIQSKGFGKTKPIADNSTPEGRALNRRVEMNIFY